MRRPAVQPAASLLELPRRGQPFSRVITAKHTPRGRLLVSRSAPPIVDAEGRLRGWRGTARHHRPDRRAEQRDPARQSCCKLAAQIPGMIFQFVRHADGRRSFPHLSRGVESVFGVPAEQVMAHPDHAFEIVHPEDRARVISGIERSGRS